MTFEVGSLFGISLQPYRSGGIYLIICYLLDSIRAHWLDSLGYARDIAGYWQHVILKTASRVQPGS